MYDPLAISTPKPRSTAARSVSGSRSAEGTPAKPSASSMNMYETARTSVLVSTTGFFSSPVLSVTS